MKVAEEKFNELEIIMTPERPHLQAGQGGEQKAKSLDFRIRCNQK